MSDPQIVACPECGGPLEASMKFYFEDVVVDVEGNFVSGRLTFVDLDADFQQLSLAERIQRWPACAEGNELNLACADCGDVPIDNLIHRGRAA